VYALLEERGALALLDDVHMELATGEIVAGGDRPRHEVQKQIKVRAAEPGSCSRVAKQVSAGWRVQL
jgi:hypothetical protein